MDGNPFIQDKRVDARNESDQKPLEKAGELPHESSLLVFDQTLEGTVHRILQRSIRFVFHIVGSLQHVEAELTVQRDAGVYPIAGRSPLPPHAMHKRERALPIAVAVSFNIIRYC
nr:hypothetical protein [Bifidobacterium catenulatum]